MSHGPIHHPSHDILLCHAAGRLSAGSALVVATHLAVCPHCRAVTRMGEGVGGVLLLEEAPANMAPDALDRALARLDMPATTPRPASAVPELGPGLPMPRPLHDVVHGPWRWVAPGISRIRLDLAGAIPGERVYLLRVAPGSTLPEHGHRGQELTCVLAGRFRDSTGTYAQGDVAEMDAGHEHQPIAEPGEACISLIVTQGRLRMHGLLARVLQPLLGV
ncbi:MAG: anti-sigma factor [Acetobacteraceae bacterium]|nr:anti-sigma factor [Acetobacteraceae bacterium]